MSWESITGEHDEPRPVPPAPSPPADVSAEAPSGFSFNLDEALSRIDAGLPPSPLAVPPSAPLAPPGPAPRDDAAEPLPPIAEATPVIAEPVAAAAGAGPAPSPLAAVAAPAPALPGPAPAPPTTAAPVIPAPTIPAPVIPATVAPPPVAAVPAAGYVAPPTAGLASSSAARRTKKRGHPFRNLVLVLLLLGGVVAAALVFGRAYLFPDEWDADLVPIVDDLEGRTGLEFDEPVAVAVVPAVDHGAAVVASRFGSDWGADLARWRAVGLASGEVDEAAIAGAVARWLPVALDPVTGDLSRSDSVVGAARDDALARALGAVLVDQQASDDAPATTAASGSVPSGSPDTPAPDGAATEGIGRQAAVTYQGALAAGLEPGAADPALLADLPAPIQHHFIAVERLGGAIVRAGGLDPDVLPIGEVLAAPLPEVLERVEAPATPAPAAQLVDGDVADGTPVAWGADRWYLALAAYLPPETAAGAADAIVADLVTPARRGDQACVYATFTPRDEAAAGVLQLSLAAWAQAAPPEAGAASSVLADGTQQLVSCDPGATTSVRPRPGGVDELLARQTARIAG